MSRALAEARVVHPALATIGYEYRAGPGLSGVAESITRHGADATARALEGLLEAILALCIRLIGDDIVATLVEKSVEECASRRAAQTEPHQRSATS
jgi:hypothetical protein